jgi:hypothetical protein
MISMIMAYRIDHRKYISISTQSYTEFSLLIAYKGGQCLAFNAGSFQESFARRRRVFAHGMNNPGGNAQCSTWLNHVRGHQVAQISRTSSLDRCQTMRAVRHCIHAVTREALYTDGRGRGNTAR